MKYMMILAKIMELSMKKMVKMLKGESPEKLMKKLGKKSGPKMKF